MKKINLLLVIVFAFASCNCQKQAVAANASDKETSADQNQLPKMVYEASTRGFYRKIVMENQVLIVTYDRSKTPRVDTLGVSYTDQDELISTFQKVNLDKLTTYKDPTQKRFYDGAAIANLTITKNGKEYRTVDFDHGFPPIEIEKLVNKIVSFDKKE